VFERAERAGGHDHSGWILYQIVKDTEHGSTGVAPAQATSVPQLCVPSWASEAEGGSAYGSTPILARMIGQEDGMTMFPSRRLKREQGSPLNEAQRALVAKKFEILRQASFGFTQGRLVHIQEEDLKGWTDACMGELRRKIASAAPSHIKIALIDFRKLRCVSLQCHSVGLLPAPIYS
jgi:hypothetical protein